MIRVRTKVTERGPGFSKLAANLGGASEITLGVQGKQAAEAHPNSELSVGQVAAVHELGLGKVPERSWLRSWMDVNAKLMVLEAAKSTQDIISGAASRKVASEKLAEHWVKALRQNIRDGKIKPALAASTKARKGHGIPLLESGAVMNGITGVVKLPALKSIRDAGMRAAVRRGPK